MDILKTFEEYGYATPELVEIRDRLNNGEDINDLAGECIENGYLEGLKYLCNVEKYAPKAMRERTDEIFLKVNTSKALRRVRKSNIDEDIKNNMINLLSDPRIIKKNKRISGW